MREWISSNNRKRHQRVLNKKVKQINDSIKDDWLWEGRFEIRQLPGAQWFLYEDGSGGQLYVRLRATDRKTGQTYDSIWYNVNELCDWKIFAFVNDSIIKEFEAWKDPEVLDKYHRGKSN